MDKLSSATKRLYTWALKRLIEVLKISNKINTVLAFLIAFTTTCKSAGFAETVAPTQTANPPSEKAPGKAGTQNDPVILALTEELQRSFSALKNVGKAPLYYLAYRLYEGTWESITASDGALRDEVPKNDWRMLSVDLRVGSPKFDNTHYQRDVASHPPHEYDATSDRNSILPNEGAGIPLKQSLWLKTDSAFKRAQQRFASIKASNDLLAVEEDKSGDFSMQPASTYFGPVKNIELDRAAWEEKVKRLSKLFLNYPHLKDTSVKLAAEPTTRYFVNSEGSREIEQHLSYRIQVSGTTIADDGMSLSLSDYDEEKDPAKLPDEKTIAKMVDKLAHNLLAFRSAPVADPYVGPAILSGRSAAVFFHETFGHRVEAQHQKNEDEGKTFAKRVGTKVMPTFITVVDDPTNSFAYGQELCGSYKYDDEGVPAQAVTLAKNGVLTSFLLGRKPVTGFKTSNGHGRSAPGWNPAARQGILRVSADPKSQVSPAQLRAQLIAEAKKQHKEYGLLFDDIYGGSTAVSTHSDQVFSIYPLRIFKIFVDGRPDQLIRGADIVGTPLAALEKIILASNDYGVFNGSCGRESGWVPNSAVAPSLLIQSMEIKHSVRSFQKLPILPDPAQAN